LIPDVWRRVAKRTICVILSDEETDGRIRVTTIAEPIERGVVRRLERFENRT